MTIFTLEIVFTRQKTQAIQYITKHVKVVASVHLENSRTKCMYLAYINTGICL